MNCVEVPWMWLGRNVRAAPMPFLFCIILQHLCEPKGGVNPVNPSPVMDWAIEPEVCWEGWHLSSWWLQGRDHVGLELCRVALTGPRDGECAGRLCVAVCVPVYSGRWSSLTVPDGVTTVVHILRQLFLVVHGWVQAVEHLLSPWKSTASVWGRVPFSLMSFKAGLALCLILEDEASQVEVGVWSLWWRWWFHPTGPHAAPLGWAAAARALGRWVCLCWSSNLPGIRLTGAWSAWDTCKASVRPPLGTKGQVPVGPLWTATALTGCRT